MSYHHLRISRSASLLTIASVALLGLVACGGGTSPTRAPNVPTSTSSLPAPQATPAGGEPTAEGLCQAFTEELAVAALGQAVAEPTSGDVVPRPNGVYCHYAAAADGNVNVEAQLKDMTRDDFESLADRLGMTESLPGVGETAFRLDRSLLGGGGATVAAWSDGRGVTVIINNESADADASVAAAAAIAAAALAD